MFVVFEGQVFPLHSSIYLISIMTFKHWPHLLLISAHFQSGQLIPPKVNITSPILSWYNSILLPTALDFHRIQWFS